MLSPGDKVKDCEVIAPLGSGGMARLYLARRRGVGGFSRLVTLKLVHPHLIEDEKIVKLFLDEARISAHVAHPNVVHVEEVGQVDGSYFIAMEYVHGVSLAELLARLTDHRLRLRPKLCVWLAAQIAEALHAAHEARSENGTPLGIVHRDVSPQNVLISHTGHVKLIDFGIARDQADDDPRVAGHAVLGKLRYMSPEQLRLLPADRRADVYALGVMLWEMLAGRNLLRCQRLDDDNDWTIRENPPPPSKYSGHSTPSLDRVVQKAIAYDPNERYDSAFQFRAALLRADPAAVTLDAPMVAALMRSMFGDELDRRRASWPSEVSGQLEDNPDEASKKWSLEELTAENVGMLPMLELDQFAREQQAREVAEQDAAANALAAIPELPMGVAASAQEAAAATADAPEAPDAATYPDLRTDGGDEDDDAEPTIAIRSRKSQAEIAAIGVPRLPSEYADWMHESTPPEGPVQPAIASVRADLMLALASASLSYNPLEGLRLAPKTRRPEPRSVRALPGLAALRLGLANVKVLARANPEPRDENIVEMPVHTTDAVVVAVSDNPIDTLECPAIPIRGLEPQQPPGLAFRVMTLGSACLVVGVFLGTLLARSPAPQPSAAGRTSDAADREAADPLVVSQPMAAAKQPAPAPIEQPAFPPLPAQDCVAGSAKARVLTSGYRDAMDTQLTAQCEPRAELGAARERTVANREARAFSKPRSSWRNSRHGSSGSLGTKRSAVRKAKWASRSAD